MLVKAAPGELKTDVCHACVVHVYGHRVSLLRHIVDVLILTRIPIAGSIKSLPRWQSPWIMYYSESCLHIQMSILWGDPGTWVDSIPNFDAIENRLTSIQKAQVFFLVLFCFCFFVFFLIMGGFGQCTHIWITKLSGGQVSPWTTFPDMV